MKKKQLITLILLTITLFAFNEIVYADLASEVREKTCAQLEDEGKIDRSNSDLVFHVDKNQYDVNCIYTYSSDSKCVIFQLAYNSTSGSYRGKAFGTTNHFGLYQHKNSFWEWIPKYEKDKAHPDSVDEGYLVGLTGSCPSNLEYVKSNYWSISFGVMDGIILDSDEKNMDRIHNTEIDIEIPPLIPNKPTDPTKDASCEELLGEKGVSFLKTLKTMLLIAVPLILIILGSLDFAKAIFAGDENDMKKAQSKFMKRVIVAVGIFLIPVILGVILDIAHGIWPNIDNSLCGLR